MKSVLSLAVPALLLMSATAFAAVSTAATMQPSGGKSDQSLSAGTGGLQGSQTGQAYMNGPNGDGSAGNGRAIRPSSMSADNGSGATMNPSVSATATSFVPSPCSVSIPSATIAASPSASAMEINSIASDISDSSRNTPSTPLASFWRSRIIFCAATGSFQMAGSSALAFSSSRRRSDLSQSKMPPQQSDGLLNLGNGTFGLGAHDGSDIRSEWRNVKVSRGRRCLHPHRPVSS